MEIHQINIDLLKEIIRNGGLDEDDERWDEIRKIEEMYCDTYIRNKAVLYELSGAVAGVTTSLYTQGFNEWELERLWNEAIAIPTKRLTFLSYAMEVISSADDDLDVSWYRMDDKMRAQIPAFLNRINSGIVIYADIEFAKLIKEKFANLFTENINVEYILGVMLSHYTDSHRSMYDLINEELAQAVGNDIKLLVLVASRADTFLNKVSQ